MPIKSFTRNIFELNLAILFISTSGVLGRYINMSPVVTIGVRAIIAALILFMYCKWKGVSFKIPRNDKKTVLIGGVFLGVHWVTYFYALQLSNVAIGMLSLFTFPAITAILEPIFFKTKVLKFHLLLGFFILIGIYFLVPDFSFQNANTKAVCFGVFSATCFSIRNIIMKSSVVKYDGSALMANQLFVVSIMCLPFCLFLGNADIINYLPATFVLALLTTVIGHTLFTYSLKYFSTTSASIISSLQPIYGVLLGVLFLKEYPEMQTIIGGVIIISTVVMESIRVYSQKNN